MFAITAGTLSPDKIILNTKEAARRLGVPEEQVSAWIDRFAPQLQKEMRPKYCYCQSPVFVGTDHWIDVGYTTMHTNDLAKHLSDCQTVYTLVVTLGLEVDRYLMRAGLTAQSDAFACDAVAAAYAEAAADAVSSLIRQELPQETVLKPRFSPGYGDVPLDIQPILLDTLNAAKYIGVTVGANLLMTPKKTITAFQGVKAL